VLECGMIVERHSVNGDYFLLNRAPSLHRLSIMAHRAIVWLAKTIGLNVEDMFPYAADADGDEFNCFAARSIFVRATIWKMAAKRHPFNAKNGDCAIRFQLLSVVGPYFFTLPKTIFNRIEASILLCQPNELTLPKPLELPESDCLLPDPTTGAMTVPGWSGRLIFSAMLPANLSLETKGAPDGVLLQPSQVVVQRGKLVSGTLNGRALGRMFSSIEKAYGSTQAANFMHNVVQMCTYHLRNYGLSVGLKDCENPNQPFTDSMRLLAEQWAVLQPGPAEHGSKAEARLLQVFDAARSRAGNVVLHTMKRQHGLSEQSMDLSKSVFRNGILELVTSGTKGSLVILQQLTVFLGLQLRNGKRITENLPLRPADQLKWVSNLNGFIGQSYYTGIAVACNCVLGNQICPILRTGSLLFFTEQDVVMSILYLFIQPSIWFTG